jgi:hypothetical protein
MAQHTRAVGPSDRTAEKSTVCIVRECMLRSSRKKAASKAINNSSTRWKKTGDLNLRERDAGWGKEHAQPKDTNARNQKSTGGSRVWSGGDIQEPEILVGEL